MNDYNELLEMWRQEKNKRQEAEGELTIIKGIGNTSPEMKTLQERVKELDNSLAIALEVNDKHQRYNGELQTRVTELEEDNKKLAQQVEDKIDQMRRSGM
jgi:pyruvate-formate lyase-activating enzyme